MLRQHQLAQFLAENRIAYFLRNCKVEFPCGIYLRQDASVHDKLPHSMLQFIDRRGAAESLDFYSNAFGIAFCSYYQPLCPKINSQGAPANRELQRIVRDGPTVFDQRLTNRLMVTI